MALKGRQEKLLVVRYADGQTEYVTAKTEALEIASPQSVALRYQRAGRLRARAHRAAIRAH